MNTSLTADIIARTLCLMILDEARRRGITIAYDVDAPKPEPRRPTFNEEISLTLEEIDSPIAILDDIFRRTAKNAVNRMPQDATSFPIELPAASYGAAIRTCDGLYVRCVPLPCESDFSARFLVSTAIT